MHHGHRIPDPGPLDPGSRVPIPPVDVK